MGEIDGKPYVTKMESKRRDFRGFRISEWRVCYPRRITRRLSRPFKTEEAAINHADQVDGFGNRSR